MSEPRRFDPLIVQGPIYRAVWRLAWPSMLQNVFAGLQGIVDHTLLGRYVGFTGNAAVGVSWQIFLVIIVFVGSVFTGMGILVARFAGAGEPDKVNRVVYQGMLASVFMTLGVLTPAGLFLTPHLLNWVNAAPEVQAEALPYLRTLFVFSAGMLFYYMLGGALRAAGDARTPLRLGMAMTGINIVLSFVLIRGWGPIPPMGALGAATGTVIASSAVGGYALWRLLAGKLVIGIDPGGTWRPNWGIIKRLLYFGLPSGFQGVAMNLGGVIMIGFVGTLAESAEAQAAYVVAYTQLFSLITWSGVGLMGSASVVVGQNLGAAKADRARKGAATGAVFGIAVALVVGFFFVAAPRSLLSIFGIDDPTVLRLGEQLLGYLTISGFFVTLALNYNGALHGAGDTRSPLAITALSQLIVPPAILVVWGHMQGTLSPSHVWGAVVVGHVLRGLLSAARFHQGRWIDIRVDLEAR